MEKTIQMMKESGLFDSLVQNIVFNGMSKDAVAVAIDKVCEIDENFEDTFFNDLHELGLCIIWKELCFEAEKLHELEAKKQESIEDLLKKIIELMSK